MAKDTAFFYIYAWNPREADFNIWIGTATREAAAKLGSRSLSR
jgi:hypothetical protein